MDSMLTEATRMDEFEVDWSTAPDWAKYHAFDGAGYTPDPGGGMWFSSYPQRISEESECFKLYDGLRGADSGYTVLSLNWRDSIRQRPEKKMETPEWIYPGAECEMRDGGKYRVYSTDGGPRRNVIHGAYETEASGWMPSCRFSSGAVNKDQSDAGDLIGPWRPWKSQIPPAEVFADWVKWVAMDKGGLWRAYQEEPRSSERAVAWHARLCSQIDMISSAIRMPTVPADQWRTTKIRIRED